jgi:surface antigen
VTVGGQPQQAVVEACQQADGSWRITQTTPGLPPQVYEVPAPAYSLYPSAYSNAYPYPDFSPYWGWEGWGWGGPPWFLGLAPSIVVVQRFHHFHHGFAHGGHGFGRGFAHGAGHGFAGMRGGGMAGGRR